MLLALPLLAPALQDQGAPAFSHAACAAFDVKRYDLAFDVDPAEKRLRGTVVVHAEVTAPTLTALVLDMDGDLEAGRILVDGAEVAGAQADDRLSVPLPRPAPKGARIAVTVEYSGSPRAEDDFTGFHWAETADKQPWISTSCQGPGARSWWPCKDSFFHAEDKPDEGTRTAITVPAGLYAVSNGRLQGIDELPDGRRTFRWAHPYPLETYSVTLNAAPYVVVESTLPVEGGGTVPWIYYAVPEDAEKAALQFQQVPQLIAIYQKAFGPWPFPDSKVALVETSFWGMEHSTAVAYGSSFPAWCAAHGEKDRYAGRNRDYDYILIHETAHEWWGNAVSASAWGHFWIHEGFGTYAEGVYLEETAGRERADAFFERTGQRLAPDARLYRGDGVDSEAAYSGVIYSKGACVLNTLRHYVDDDEAWWKTLRAFNLRFRYGNASSDDFRAVLEETTGRPFKRFFDEWVYGEGQPQVTGTVRAAGSTIAVEVDNAATGATTFGVPLDLAWTEGGEPHAQRLWLEPGPFAHTLPCGAPPAGLRVVNLARVLGAHDVRAE